MKRYYLLFPFLALFTASCEQNPDSPEPSGPFVLSGQVKEYIFKGIHDTSDLGELVHAQTTYSFSYDSEGRVAQFETKDYFGNFGESGWELQLAEDRILEYTYSGGTVTIKQNGADYGTITLDSKGRVEKEETSARGGTNTTTFTYDENNNLSTCEILTSTGGNTLYEYTWSNGDVSQIKVGIKGYDAAEIYKFSYSEKENPFKDILDVPYYFLAPGFIYMPLGMAGNKNAHQFSGESAPYPTTYTFATNLNGQITNLTYPTDMGRVVIEITYYE